MCVDPHVGLSLLAFVGSATNLHTHARTLSHSTVQQLTFPPGVPVGTGFASTGTLGANNPFGRPQMTGQQMTGAGGAAQLQQQTGQQQQRPTDQPFFQI